MCEYEDDMTPLERLLQPLFRWEREQIEKQKARKCAEEGHTLSLVDSFSFPPHDRKIHKFRCGCGELSKLIYVDTGVEVPSEDVRTGIWEHLERGTYVFDLLPKEPWGAHAVEMIEE